MPRAVEVELFRQGRVVGSKVRHARAAGRERVGGLHCRKTRLKTRLKKRRRLKSGTDDRRKIEQG